MARRLAKWREGLSYVLGLYIVVVGAACPGIGRGGTPGMGQRPECPESGMWSHVFSTDTSAFRVAANGFTAAAGEATDIPEFHDCQQFVVSTKDSLRFTSLFAIFARVGTENLLPGGERMLRRQRETPDLDSLRLSAPGAPVFIAEIFAYDSAYPPLGVEKGFNCLFVRSNGAKELTAVMVPLHALKDEACWTITNPNGVQLDVTRLTMTDARRTDYPPVARWEWDATNTLQYIGVKCGAAWCQIHKKGGPFVAAALYSRQAQVAKADGAPFAKQEYIMNRRVVEIPGWYDQQLLMVPNRKSDTGDTRFVSRLMGTLIPDPHLIDDSLLDSQPASSATRYDTGWVRVASVAIESQRKGNSLDADIANHLDTYSQKLAIGESAMPNPVNSIWLCHSTVSSGAPCILAGVKTPQCDPEAASSNSWWYQRSDAPGAPSVIHCVIRRTHQFFKIPAVVRWRWKLDDDTYWTHCPSGCCETKPRA